METIQHIINTLWEIRYGLLTCLIVLIVITFGTWLILKQTQTNGGKN